MIGTLATNGLGFTVVAQQKPAQSVTRAMRYIFDGIWQRVLDRIRGDFEELGQ